MRKSRFTDHQILAISKQAEPGVPVPELCREQGMSSVTFYKWRAKLPGLTFRHTAPKGHRIGGRSCVQDRIV